MICIQMYGRKVKDNSLLIGIYFVLPYFCLSEEDKRELFFNEIHKSFHFFFFSSEFKRSQLNCSFFFVDFFSSLIPKRERNEKKLKKKSSSELNLIRDRAQVSSWRSFCYLSLSLSQTRERDVKIKKTI